MPSFAIVLAVRRLHGRARETRLDCGLVLISCESADTSFQEINNVKSNLTSCTVDPTKHGLESVPRREAGKFKKTTKNHPQNKNSSYHCCDSGGCDSRGSCDAGIVIWDSSGCFDTEVCW